MLLKVSATAWALWSAGQAYGQCADTTTTLWYETTAVRMNGNAVRLNGQTRITGDYYNWWYTEADAAFYFNNTREDLSGWYHSNTLGGELDLGYTPTLQTYGAGQYYQSTVHDAYTPDCTYGGSSNTFSAMCAAWPAHCNIPPPWNSSSSINISRPTRPDYGTAGHPVYYLGPGIASDHAYSNNTSLIAGNANGAPETPQWVFTAGSQFGTISCQGLPACNQPLFTATKRSTGCLTYDVVLNTSYNGFLSDPFFMFINAPNNLEASTWEGEWNYTSAWENGYYSWIFYTTDTLCATDGPMSGYDMNEEFGTWTKDPSQPTVSWTPPTAGGWPVTLTQWYDQVEFACPGLNCTPMPKNPPSGCWPACGTVKVQSGPQTFSVGAEASGQGIAVQTDTQQRWLDHGSHEQIVTPVH